ncbi:MAG: glycoside hydrolase family protein [Niameybacter sp.]
MDTFNLMKHMKPAPRNGGFKMEGYWVWCGSVIKAEDNRYHMFASRWPRSIPMHPGWLTNSEIVRAVSDTPEGPYEFQEVVLPARGPQYWDGCATHNPSIIKYKDTYILYYVGDTHPFLNVDVENGEQIKHKDPRTVSARANKRVGMAVAKHIEGPWERFDEPILKPRPECYDNLLVSNPAPCVDEKGNVTMIYKSRSYLKEPVGGFLHGPMSLGVAKGHIEDRFSYHAVTDEPIFDYRSSHLEDPFVWKDEKGFHMIAKDMEGKTCGEEHGGIYAFSKDGISWEIQKGQQAYSRKIKWDDGTTQVMGSLERPFILFEEGRPTHMFFATADGPGGFERATTTWNMVIPLK